MWKSCRINLVWVIPLIAFSLSSSSSLLHAQSQTSETIVVDASAPAHPFPHFWEHIFGSGRAALSLRDSYRQDLRDVHKVYEAMGSPRYPTQAQIRQLRSASQLPAPDVYELKNGSVTVNIPAHGLVLLELRALVRPDGWTLP